MFLLITVIAVMFQAGDKGEDINPKVQLFLVNLQLISSRHRQFLPPAEFQNKCVSKSSSIELPDIRITTYTRIHVFE